MGDDAATPEVDGFAVGEGFAFRLFDAASGSEYAAVAAYADGPQSLDGEWLYAAQSGLHDPGDTSSER